jgi:hypothetical protein
MTVYLFANNAKSTLAAPLATTDTTVILSAGTGALFPNPTGGDLFTLTLTDAASGTIYEILHCTARTADTLTVTRAQEGTTALNWAAGDFANNFLTAGTAALFAQGSGAFVNPMTAKGDLIAGAAGGTPARLAVGADGDVLSADSTQPDGVKWEVPPWLVSPLTTKGDLIAAIAGGAASRLAVGTDGQVLAANSGAADGVSWETAPWLISPITTKGDLIVGDAGGASVRIPVGTDGYVLMADSTQPDGVKWAAGGGGGGGSPPAVNPQTGTSYSLALTDAPTASSSQGIVTMNNAVPNDVLVTKSATVAWLTGTIIQIIQLGAGQTTLTADTGVTLNTAGSLSTRVQNSAIILTYLGSDQWMVGGDTA